MKKTKEQRGQELAGILELKRDRDYKGKDVRYKTTWGNKTTLGVYETALRILTE